MARPKNETVVEEVAAAPAEDAGVAVKPVKVLAFKVDTSRCMALEGQYIDLPVDEADALIASGACEAA